MKYHAFILNVMFAVVSGMKCFHLLSQFYFITYSQTQKACSLTLVPIQSAAFSQRLGYVFFWTTVITVTRSVSSNCEVHQNHTTLQTRRKIFLTIPS
jgi:hypothetical protein